MAVSNMQAVILSAGRSSRFNTGKSKLLEKICGQEMVIYVTKLLQTLNIPTTAVVGCYKEQVQDIITKYHGDTVLFVEQAEQLGTGHALLCSRETWHAENILVINGDMPLINADIIENLYQRHLELNAAITFAISHQTDTEVGAYGRLVITDGVMEIIEAREFNGDTSEHCFINAGIYLIKRSYLEQAISQVHKNQTSKEFYITDLIKIASKAYLPVGSVIVPFDQVRGINTIEELWTADQIKKAELIKHWMSKGVRFYATHNLHLDYDVEIGAGTYIGCGVHLLRGTKIGKNCSIHENVSIYSSIIADHAAILPNTLVTNATIGDHAQVGPFAHVHSNAILEPGTVVGNFVEVKNTRLGAQSKAKHLTYLGDADIGSHVNIGAGTITCNYDGSQKHKTVIHDDCFIGSNNTLVAPVTIEKNSYTAAGSVITETVPEDSLAIARARQINKEGYAQTMRNRQQQEETEKIFPAKKQTGNHETSM